MAEKYQQSTEESFKQKHCETSMRRPTNEDSAISTEHSKVHVIRRPSLMCP